MKVALNQCAAKGYNAGDYINIHSYGSAPRLLCQAIPERKKGSSQAAEGPKLFAALFDVELVPVHRVKTSSSGSENSMCPPQGA